MQSSIDQSSPVLVDILSMLNTSESSNLELMTRLATKEDSNEKVRGAAAKAIGRAASIQSSDATSLIASLVSMAKSPTLGIQARLGAIEGLKIALLGITGPFGQPIKSKGQGILHLINDIASSSSSSSISDPTNLLTEVKSTIQALESLALPSASNVNGLLSSMSSWVLAHICHVTQQEITGKKAESAPSGDASSKAMKPISSYPSLPTGVMKPFNDLFDAACRSSNSLSSTLSITNILRVLSHCPILPPGFDWITRLKHLWFVKTLDAQSQLELRKAILELTINQGSDVGSESFGALIDELIEQVLSDLDTELLFLLLQRLLQVLNCLSETRKREALDSLVRKVIALTRKDTDHLPLSCQLWAGLSNLFQASMRPLTASEEEVLSLALTSLPSLPPLLPGIISSMRLNLQQKEAPGLLNPCKSLHVWMHAVYCVKVAFACQQKGYQSLFLDRLLPVRLDQQGGKLETSFMQMRCFLSLCGAVGFRDLVVCRSLLIQGRLDVEASSSLFSLLPEALNSAGATNQSLVLQEAFDLCHQASDAKVNLSLKLIACCVACWSSPLFEVSRDTPSLLQSMDRHLASSPEDAVQLLPYSFAKLLDQPLWLGSRTLFVQKLFDLLTMNQSVDLKRIVSSTLVALVSQDCGTIDDKMTLIGYL